MTRKNINNDKNDLLEKMKDNTVVEDKEVVKTVSKPEINNKPEIEHMICKNIKMFHYLKRCGLRYVKKYIDYKNHRPFYIYEADESCIKAMSNYFRARDDMLDQLAGGEII